MRSRALAEAEWTASVRGVPRYVEGVHLAVQAVSVAGLLALQEQPALSAVTLAAVDSLSTARHLRSSRYAVAEMIEWLPGA